MIGSSFSGHQDPDDTTPVAVESSQAIPIHVKRKPEQGSSDEHELKRTCLDRPSSPELYGMNSVTFQQKIGCDEHTVDSSDKRDTMSESYAVMKDHSWSDNSTAPSMHEQRITSPDPSAPSCAWILATDTLLGPVTLPSDETISIPPSPDAKQSFSPMFQRKKMLDDSDQPEPLKKSVQFSFDLGSQLHMHKSPSSLGMTRSAPSTERTERIKRNPHFSEAEDRMLEIAVAQFGESWDQVRNLSGFKDSSRTPQSLKARWLRLHSKKKEIEWAHSAPTSPLPTTKAQGLDQGLKESDCNLAEWNNTGGNHVRQKTSDSEMASKENSDIKLPPGHLAPKTPQKHTKKIHEYFHRANNGSSPRIRKLQLPVSLSQHEKPGELSPVHVLSNEEKLQERVFILEKELKYRDDKIRTLEETIEALKRVSNGAQQEFEKAKESFNENLEDWRTKYDTLSKKFSEWASKSKNVIIDTLRTSYALKWRESNRRLAENNLRLASMVSSQRGSDFQECWQMGYIFSDIQDKLNAIQQEKDTLDKRKKQLSKLLKANGKDMTNTNEGKMELQEPLLIHPVAGKIEIPSTESENIQLFEEEDIVKHRLLALKKEESDLLATLDKYTVERNLHICENRRIRDQELSRFNNNPLLNERYLLLEMIGKGGFSEVYKAFDMVQLEIVACKIHSLNEQWSDERKLSYIKHSSRECRIHQSLQHPNVVQMIDVFEHDSLSFCTVLEYVDGLDLETHLRTVKTMPEKEARCVLVQVMQALKYMNGLENPIIHYDLKPANILLRHGLVKVTDFGLSKILDSNNSGPSATSSIGTLFKPKEIELTSVGAGTYWYLPPEVFQIHGATPIKISSKVDVWSIGCIFYEMLYGKKPFGNDISQQRLLQEDWISHEALNSLPFPTKPSVSNEAKQFIRRCLEYHQDKRPDILTIVKEPYLQPFTNAVKSNPNQGKRMTLTECR